MATLQATFYLADCNRSQPGNSDSPQFLGAASNAGGVMGKMIDAQSSVLAGVATGQQGSEGTILRFVFWHSVALASLMAVVVFLIAYAFPWMVPAVSK